MVAARRIQRSRQSRKPGVDVGVHGKSVDLHLEKLWDRNITITTRLVDTETTPMLLKGVQSRKLQPQKLVTHRFALHDAAVGKPVREYYQAWNEGADLPPPGVQMVWAT